MLVIQESGPAGQLFGCFTSEGWRQEQGAYGNGECFVFSFSAASQAYGTTFESWGWTHKNDVFMSSRPDELSLGAGGDGAALSMDGRLCNGLSNQCATFGSSSLASDRMFQVHEVEVWGLGWTPLPDLDGDNISLVVRDDEH